MHDLKGHIENFRRQLRALRFRQDVDYYKMSQGNPGAFIDFYRHLLCDHSAELTKLLVEKGFAILGTSDYRFMEAVYRILRDLLRLHPPITLTQFYTSGFAEKKLEMASHFASRLNTLVARPTFNARLTKQGNMRQCRGSHQISKFKPFVTSVLPEVPCLLVETDKCHPISQHCGDLSPVSSPIPACKMTNPTQHETRATHQLFDGHSSSSCQSSCKVSTNGLELEPSRTTTSISNSIRQINPPSMFSAFIPTVGQVNQSHRRPHSALMMNEQYARYGKMCHSLNSNPRPGCHDILPNVKLPPASQQHIYPYDTINTSASTIKQVPRISITPEKLSSSSADTVKEVHTTRDVVQDILNSLSLLTGKVDTMLSRLDRLELRLSGPPTSEHCFETRSSNLKLPSHDDPPKACRTSGSNGKSGVRHSVAFAESPHHPERTLTPPSDQFFLTVSVPPLIPSSTTAVESVLSSPKCHRPHGGTQSSSSLSTIEMPYQITHTAPSDEPKINPVHVSCSPSAPHSSSLANRPASANRIGFASVRATSNDRFPQRGPNRPSLLRTGYSASIQSYRTTLPREVNTSQPVSTSGDWRSGTTRESPVGTNSPTRQAEGGIRGSPSVVSRVLHEQNVRQSPPLSRRWNYSPRLYKPVMFRDVESLDCGNSNSAVVESMNEIQTNINSESYLAQVDRITSMLAETQSLLKSKHLSVAAEEA